MGGGKNTWERTKEEMSDNPADTLKHMTSSIVSKSHAGAETEAKVEALMHTAKQLEIFFLKAQNEHAETSCSAVQREIVALKAEISEKDALIVKTLEDLE